MNDSDIGCLLMHFSSGYGFPFMPILGHDRCTPDSCGFCRPKSAGSDQKRSFLSTLGAVLKAARRPGRLLTLGAANPTVAPLPLA